MIDPGSDTGPPGSNVDWELAASVGRRLARNGPPTTDYTQRRAAAQLLEFAATAEEHVRRVTGLATGEQIPAARIVDRREWIDAAAVSMSSLLGGDTTGREPHRGLRIGARIAGLQTGAALAFISESILGQYDPFGTPEGTLLLVAPNVVRVERALRVSPTDFRRWVCLHEVTHRVQFAANPWLRDFMRGNVADLTADRNGDQDSTRELIGRVAAALRGRQPRGGTNGDGTNRAGANRAGAVGLLQAVSSPGQATAIDNLLRLGTLLEGHADHVMDSVGSEVIPTVSTIRAAFDRRRNAPTNPLQRVLRTLLGVDAKIAQYVRGKSFVDSVVAQVGMAQFNAVWAGPDSLPRDDEFDHPDRWIARVT